jgi:hypothetical protein
VAWTRGGSVTLDLSLRLKFHSKQVKLCSLSSV